MVIAVSDDSLQNWLQTEVGCRIGEIGTGDKGHRGEAEAKGVAAWILDSVRCRAVLQIHEISSSCLIGLIGLII